MNLGWKRCICFLEYYFCNHKGVILGAEDGGRRNRQCTLKWRPITLRKRKQHQETMYFADWEEIQVSLNFLIDVKDFQDRRSTWFTVLRKWGLFFFFWFLSEWWVYVFHYCTRSDFFGPTTDFWGCSSLPAIKASSAKWIVKAVKKTGGEEKK